MIDNNNFPEEVKKLAKRAECYATCAYEILSKPKHSAKLPLAIGYISCGLSYVTNVRSILLAHPNTGNNELLGFLDYFEDFSDTALMFVNGNKTIEDLESAYASTQGLL